MSYRREHYAPQGWYEDLGGLVDWHVTDTAAVIQNKRREGMSDAQITTWLLSPENRGTYSKACPWGCTDEKVNAAFEYLRTGKFPTGTTLVTTKSPTTKPPTKPPAAGSFPVVPVLIGGAALLALVLWRSR